MGNDEGKNKRIKLDPRQVNKMIEEVNFKNEKGFSKYDNPLTEKEIEQLERLQEYLNYDKMLEERADMIIDIEIKKEVLNNLDNTIEEYRGGLRNYRSTQINTLYSILSRVIDVSIGFITASIIYNGFNVFKVPSLWMYLGTVSILYTLISYLEYSRYNNMKKKEK